MRNLRYYYKFILAFISRFKGILFVGLLAGVLIFLFLKFIYPLFALVSQEKIGIIGKYSTVNLPLPILNLISGGLTQSTESGLVEPQFASSWESSDNGKAWIFHLKSGVLWQDGKEIKSSDLIYNFSDVLVEKPDEKTIVFRLKSAFSPFPNTASRPIFKRGFLGFGPWKVSKITVSGGFVQRIVLTNNQRQQKTFIFYPTEERAKLGFKLGQINKLEDVLNISPIDSWKTANVSEKPKKDEVAAIFFDTSENSKLLSDKTIRQALSYAINKQSLLLRNKDELGSLRAISPISPLSWAYNPQVKPYDYNPIKAKEIIDNLSKELKQNLNIRLVTTPVLLTQAEKIAKYWEDVGLDVTLQVTSVKPPDFDAYLAIFDIPKDPDQYAFWHSSQTSTNICKYTNPRIDKLLEDGRTELDQGTRKNIYMDFQRFLVEDSPAIFLYHPTSYTIERK